MERFRKLKPWTQTITLTNVHYGDNDEISKKKSAVPYKSINTLSYVPHSEMSISMDPYSFVSVDESSYKLKEFYKKLLETEAQISKLKKCFPSSEYPYDRRKRSLFHHKSKHKKTKTTPKTKGKQTTKVKTKEKDKNTKLQDKAKPKDRERREANESDERAFIYEKKKVIVKFLPQAKDMNAFPKCSHDLKDGNTQESYEGQQKHPFYKTSQKFDDLLDQYLKNKVFTPSDKDDATTEGQVSTEGFKTDWKDEFQGERVADVKNAVSTFVGRRLLQNEDIEEEGLAYEDFNEVLSDETEPHHDENDKEIKRKKRQQMISNDKKLQPLRGYNKDNNPDWKDGIPSDPDELSNSYNNNAELKKIQAKPEIPDIVVLSKNFAETNLEKDLSDVEYIEDYCDNKYEKLVKMAQAYSDYGVLEGKKENLRNEKTKANMKVDRVKMSAEKKSPDVKKAINKKQKISVKDKNKQKKGKANTDKNISEGFKISMKPGSQVKTATKDAFDKLKNPSKAEEKTKLLTAFAADRNKINEQHVTDKPHTINDRKVKEDKVKNKNNNDKEIYSLNRVKRSLKSFEEGMNEFDIDDPFIEKLLIDTSGFTGITYNDKKRSKTNKTKIKRSLENDKEGSVTKSDMDIEVTKQVNKTKDDWLQIDAIETLIEFLPNTSFDDFDDNITNADNSTGEFDFKFKIEAKRSIKTIDLEGDASLIENGRIVNDAKSKIANDTDTNQNLGNITNDSELNDTKLVEHDIKNKTESSPFDIMTLLSNVFNTLAGLAVDLNKNNDTSSDRILNLVTSLSNKSENEKKDIMYPIYDSDMVDNIGHRSRVLLSFDETDVKKYSNDDKEVKDKRDVPKSDLNATAYTVYPPTSVPNETNTDIFDETTKNDIPYLTTTANKTIVKRDTESKLTFWNDIYDDEYGIQIESRPFEKAKDKEILINDGVKKNEFWFQEKVKKLADKVKKGSKDQFNKLYNSYSKRKSRNAFGFATPNPKQAERIKSRDLPSYYEGNGDDFYYENTNLRHSFALLNTRMKKICRQAAQAVQKTRSAKPGNGPDPENKASVGLMHQLVKLMMDLVDTQVQKSTCQTLPTDLKEFLAWLTNPQGDTSFNEEAQFKRPYISHPPRVQEQGQVFYEDGVDLEGQDISVAELKKKKLQKQEQVMNFINEEDTKSECLTTLRAVEELIQQYDQMSEEDKSKMMGVREYLEHQLNYLNRQLYFIDEYNMSKLYPNKLNRKRRDLKKKINKRHNLRSQKPKKLGKFMRNFGKKHTRTTANSYENIQISTDEVKRDVSKIKEEKIESKKEGKKDAKRADVASNGDLNADLTDEHKGNQADTKDRTKTKLADNSKLKRSFVEPRKFTTLKGLNQQYDGFERPDLIRIQH